MDLHDLPCFVLLILLLPLSPSKQVGFGWSGLCHFVSNWLSLCHNIDNCSSWPPLTHHFLQGIGISKSAQRRRRATSVLLFLLMFGLDDLTILWCVTGFNAKKGHTGWLRNAQLHNDVWGVWSTKCIGEVQNLHQASCFLSPSFILHNVLVPSETRVGSAWSCHFRILHDLGMPWNVFLSLPLSLYVYMYVDVYNYIIRKIRPPGSSHFQALSCWFLLMVALCSRPREFPRLRRTITKWYSQRHSGMFDLFLHGKRLVTLRMFTVTSLMITIINPIRRWDAQDETAMVDRLVFSALSRHRHHWIIISQPWCW